MVCWMLVHLVSWSDGCGATVYILNSVLFACGGESDVEMRGIHFDLACSGD